MSLLLIAILIAIIIATYFLYIKKEYYQYDPKIDHLKSILNKIDPSLTDIPIYTGKSSFTINKKNIYLCLKDKYGQYYSDNMLIYVLLHEVAHVFK